MARPNERSVAPQFIQPPMRPKSGGRSQHQGVGHEQGPEGLHRSLVRSEMRDAAQQSGEDQRRRDGIGQRAEHDGGAGAGEGGAVGLHLAPAVRQGVFGRSVREEGAFTHGVLQLGGEARQDRGTRAHRRARWTSDCVRAVSPAVSRPASVTSGAEVGPGHPGPPSDGTRPKTGGWTRTADAISDGRVVHVVSVVIPAMWSPRFRLVVQPGNGSPEHRETVEKRVN